MQDIIDYLRLNAAGESAVKFELRITTDDDDEDDQEQEDVPDPWQVRIDDMDGVIVARVNATTREPYATARDAFDAVEKMRGELLALGYDEKYSAALEARKGPYTTRWRGKLNIGLARS